jgi:hypothetical protein
MLDELRARWRLRFTKRTRIADLEVGKIAKVVGTARAAEPLVSPFTGQTCVCFSVVGYRTRQREQPALIDDVDEGQTFLLEDETGAVRIDRKGYSALLVPTYTIRTGAELGAKGNIERYIARHGRENVPFFDGFSASLGTQLVTGGSELWYREQVVRFDSRVAVLGVVSDTGELAPDVGRAGGYRDARRLLQLEPPDTAHLVISDRPTHLR